MPQLLTRDVAMVVLASEVARNPYAAERTIRAEFDMSVPRFLQATNRLLDDPEVLAARPLEVRRLLRIRESRARSRSAKRLP